MRIYKGNDLKTLQLISFFQFLKKISFVTIKIEENLVNFTYEHVVEKYTV